MKIVKALTAASVAVLVAGEASAEPIFACSFGPTKVSVTTVGGRLVYRYGTSGRDDLTIIEDPSKRNVFGYIDRGAYWGFSSVRFRNGEYSYAVANFISGGRDPMDESYLVVMKGSKLIARKVCRDEGLVELDRPDRLPVDPMGDTIQEFAVK